METIMTQNRIGNLAVLSFALIFAACGGDSESKSATTAGDDGRDVATLVDMGRCTSEREGDSVYVAEKLKDYLCHNNTWIDLSDVPSDLSSSNIDAETKSSSSNVVEPLSSFTGDSDLTDPGSSDSALSEMETVIGVCEKQNAGVVSEYNSAYYICKDNAWSEASVFEYDTYGKSCLTDGSIIAGEVIVSKKYVCDADTFRIATDDEINLGLGCTNYTEGEEIILSGTVADTVWTCATSKWTEKYLFSSVYDESTQLLTDLRDNQVYKTMTIGSQTWMVEDLRFEANGGACGGGCSYSWGNSMDSMGVFSKNSKGCGYGTTCSYSVPVRGICPKGWHLPISSELQELYSAIGCGNLGNLGCGDALGQTCPSEIWGDFKDAFFESSSTTYWTADQVGEQVLSDYDAYYWQWFDNFGCLSLYRGYGKNERRGIRCLKDSD